MSSKAKKKRSESPEPISTGAGAERGVEPSAKGRSVDRRSFVLSRAGRWGRVLAYVGVVAVGITGLATASAYGDVKRTALELGNELGTFEDVGGANRPIVLNGQPVYLTNTVQDIPFDVVLDRIEEHCRRNSAGLRSELENLSETVRKDLAEEIEGPEADAILREEESDRGVVVCLVSEGERSLFDRFQRFAETGNVSEIGQLRYVYARRTSNGSTHVVATWTDGYFNLRNFFPVEGDAPGQDPDGAARPPSSRRLLEARIQDVPYGTWVYSSTEQPVAVMESVDAGMVEKGWRPLKRDMRQQSLVYTKDGRDLFVSTASHKGRTVVSMIQIPGE